MTRTRTAVPTHSGVTRRRRLARAATLVVLALGVTVASASAQITEKQAIAALRTAGKAAVKQIKTDIKTAGGVFQIQLAAFRAEVKSGDYSVDKMLTMLGQLDQLQSAIAQTVKTEHSLAVSAGAAATLGMFANGVPLNGIYPTGFYSGFGSELERIRRDIERTVARSHAKFVKRLAQTRVLLEKQAGVAMQFRVAPTLPFKKTSVGTGFTFSLSQDEPLVLDTLVTFSALDTADDGRMWVSGYAEVGLGDVLFSGTPSLITNDPIEVELSTGRWAKLYDSISEGNYAVRVRQGVGAQSVIDTIGVR